MLRRLHQLRPGAAPGQKANTRLGRVELAQRDKGANIALRMAVNQALMIEGAAYRIFNPLGIEAAAGIGGVLGRAKAAHGKGLCRQLAQRRNIRFHGDVGARISRVAHR